MAHFAPLRIVTGLRIRVGKNECVCDIVCRAEVNYRA